MDNASKIFSLLLPGWLGRLFSKRDLSIPPSLLVFPETDTLAATPRIKGPRNEEEADAEELIDVLRVLIRKAAIQGYSKRWLLGALKTTLCPFVHLAGTMQELAILLFIARSVARNCPYVLDRDELKSLWG
jgi:hypothetical protein